MQKGLWEEEADMIRLETHLQGSGYTHIAGLDEAGRGPLAGPVVAAAVILPAGERYEGLTDSKLLRPDQRDNWFQIILDVSVDYAIAQISEKDIDEWNILVATRKAMETAVNGLSRQPDYLLVDGIIPLESTVPQSCIIKGDRRSQSIAAASILAKVTRDRFMEEMHEKYPQYNFRKNKGYGTQEHRKALKRFGCCPIHRKSFRGVQAVDSPAGDIDQKELFSEERHT